VGPRIGLDTLEKRKIYFPCWDSNPRLPSLQPSHYKDYGISYAVLHPKPVQNTPCANNTKTKFTCYNLCISSLSKHRDRKNICASICDGERETDRHKLPVITMGPSDRAQTPTQNISYIFK